MAQTDSKETAKGVSGVPGLSIWAGLLQEEYLLQLKGTRRNKIFREMRDDAVIGTYCTALLSRCGDASLPSAVDNGAVLVMPVGLPEHSNPFCHRP